MDSYQTDIPVSLEPLMAEIREFHASDEDSRLLDHELTKKERYAIHAYIDSLGLGSESVTLRGTNNKKIRILRQSEPKDLSNRPVDCEDIDCFSSNVGAPFPCTDPPLAEYYIEQFEPMFGTRKMWDIFLSERRSGISVKQEISRTREEICRRIRDSPNYQAYQQLRLRGQSNRIRGDVYHHGSDGKTFVSLDIQSANFTCIRLICPEIFTDQSGAPPSKIWHDFVRSITDSEFVAQSKIFREIVFGKLGFAKGANVLQEAIMERVDQVLRADETLGKIFNAETIRMKCGDENVYELVDTPIQIGENKFMHPEDLLLRKIADCSLHNVMQQIKISEIPVLVQLFKALSFDTDQTLGDIFHIRVFKVNKIGSKKYFVKTFNYRSDWNVRFVVPTHDGDSSSNGRCPVLIQHLDDDVPLRQLIEFKRVDKKFYLQVLKYYQGQKIDERDLYFTDSGIKAKYCYSIFE